MARLSNDAGRDDVVVACAEGTDEHVTRPIPMMPMARTGRNVIAGNLSAGRTADERARQVWGKH